MQGYSVWGWERGGPVFISGGSCLMVRQHSRDAMGILREEVLQGWSQINKRL